jgi:hypothetical protein
MSTKRCVFALTAENFYAVSAATVKQTIAESVITYSIDMGSFTVFHGSRDGQPIIIAEHHDQKPDELSAVWYDDGHGNDRTPDNAQD